MHLITPDRYRLVTAVHNYDYYYYVLPKQVAQAQVKKINIYKIAGNPQSPAPQETD